MDREIKSAWVRALRSGDYQQGTGALHTISDQHGERFCVLGVLGQVLENRGLLAGCSVDTREKQTVDYSGGPEFQFGTEKRIGYRMPADAESDRLYDSVIPWQMLEAAGMHYAQQMVVESLWRMNDAGIGFSKLADHIDRLNAL